MSGGFPGDATQDLLIITSLQQTLTFRKVTSPVGDSMRQFSELLAGRSLDPTEPDGAGVGRPTGMPCPVDQSGSNLEVD